MNNVLIGKLGEAHAENFLNANNYQILQKNFRSRFGEIDIIALDLNQKSAYPGYRTDRRRESQLVFIEVKTRTSDVFGAPQESISAKKLSRIFKTAIHFLNHATKSRSEHKGEQNERSENLFTTKKFYTHCLYCHWRIDAIAVKLDHNHKLQTIDHLKNILDGYG